MKVDISSQDRRNIVLNGQGGGVTGLSQMQSPMSQMNSSVYSASGVQNKFGF